MHVYSLQVRKVAASVSALLLVGCLQQEAPLLNEKVDAADCSSVANVSAKNVFCSAHGWRSIATGYSHSSYNGYQQTPATYWTGQKIITWGDMVGEHETSAGEIYDPVTNSWSSFSSANAPRARTNFVSAFTGTELLVWGGMARFANEPFVFNDGGAYNLDTGVWTRPNKPLGKLTPAEFAKLHGVVV